MNIFDAHISGSLSVSGSSDFTGDVNVSGIISGTFTGSFSGDGSNITNIPASGVTGLNLTQIADDTVTASISQTDGFKVNTNAEITGTLKVTGGILSNGQGLISGSSQLTSSYDQRYVLSGSITQTTWDNIANKPDGIVSGSVQVQITGTTGYNTFSSSISNSINNLSSSFSETNSTQNSRLTSIESTTSSLNTFSSSIDTTIKNKLNTESVISGSVQVNITGTTGYSTFSSSVSTTIGDLSGSISSINNTQNGRLNSLETESGSVRNDFNSYTSSNDSTNTTQNGRLTSLESSTGSLNTFTSSINTAIKDKMNADGVLSGSITFDISVIPGFTGLTESVSSSISSSVNELSGSLTLTVTNLSSSLTNTDENQNNRIISLESSTGSLNTFTSSINTTIKNKLNTEGVISGSVQVDITNTTNYSSYSASVATLNDSTNTALSTSIATTDLGQNTRLSTIESRYATTGSNSFNGTQNITGSLYISQNLVVYGSSSITYVTSSQLNVQSSYISVNVNEPSERFGGLKVYDSGSSNATASLSWDSLNNRWVYQNASGSNYSGAMLIMGPRNTGSLGDEVALTSGRIPKSVGGDHIDNSVMSETNGSIGISGSLIVTGSLLSTGTSLVSGSSQITFSGISGLPTLVSGSSQISFNGITDKPTLVSGSSQIDHNATTNYDSNKHIDHTSVSISTGFGLSGGGTIAATRTLSVDTTGVASVSGSQTLTNKTISGASNTLSNIGNSSLTNSSITIAGTATSLGGTISAATILTSTGVWSGSAQLPSGVVSGSAQVLNGTTIHSGTFFNGISVVSGSAQITFSGISGLPTLVSGSSQISYTGLSNIPTGIVSGSAQLSSTFVAKAGDTMTGQLIVGSTGLGNAATLKINNSSAASFNHSIEAFSANMTSTQTSLIVLGKEGSTKNAGYLGYYWSSLASNNNFVSLGHWGADNLLRVYGDGSVYMGTVTTGVWNGTAIGDSYISSSTNWNTAYNKRISTLGFTSSTVTITLADSNTVTASVPTFNQNTTGTASNITAYTINQNVGSGNSPTFTGLYLGDGVYTYADTNRDAGAAAYYPNAWTRGFRFSFANASSTSTGGNYSGVLHFHPWDGTTSSTGDASYQFAFGSTSSNGGGMPQLRLRKGIDTTWNSWYTVPIKVTSSFSSVSSVSVTHNLNSKDVMVMCYDNSDNMFWPSSIVTTSVNVVDITFTTARTGRVVIIG